MKKAFLIFLLAIMVLFTAFAAKEDIKVGLSIDGIGVVNVPDKIIELLDSEGYTIDYPYDVALTAFLDYQINDNWDVYVKYGTDAFGLLNIVVYTAADHSVVEYLQAGMPQYFGIGTQYRLTDIVLDKDIHYPVKLGLEVSRFDSVIIDGFNANDVFMKLSASLGIEKKVSLGCLDFETFAKAYLSYRTDLEYHFEPSFSIGISKVF